MSTETPGPYTQAHREAQRRSYGAKEQVILGVGKFLEDPSDTNMYALQDTYDELIAATGLQKTAYRAWKDSDEYPIKVERVPGTTKIVPAAPVDTMSVKDVTTPDGPMGRWFKKNFGRKSDE